MTPGLPSSLPAYEAAHVVVLMPTTQGHRVALQWSLGMSLLGFPCGHQFALRTDYAVDQARELLLQDALAAPGATHCLWWDDDVWPQPDALSRLMRHRYPIVSGIYLDRRGQIVAGNFHDGRREALDRPASPPQPGHALFVDAVGLGFCLMDLRIFRHLPRPWFVYDRTFSEDFYLCWNIRERLGIRVLLDGDVLLGHESPMLVQPDGSVRFAFAVPGSEARVV